MRQFTILIFVCRKFVSFCLLFLSLVAFHCSHQNRQTEREASVARARLLLEKSNKLKPQDLRIINTTWPKISEYVLSGDYAQYGFIWRLPDKEVTLFGQGSLVTLDGSEIAIKPITDNQK